MRIAIVTETWPPEINGVALTVQALALGLADHGHSVELIRPRQASDAGGTVTSRLEEVLMRGAAVPRYPGLRFGLPAHRRLRQRWSARRPDAIYVATEGPLGLTAIGAARRLGLPIATGFHTRFDDFARHYGFGFLTPMVFAYLRRFHNRADATLVPTAQLATFLTDNGFADVQLLQRGVDTAVFHPARRDERLRAQWNLVGDALAVIHIGRIAPEKNLELAVAAFRAIERERPGSRFVVVGDGPARAALAAANPDFIFAGMQRGDALGAHYASGDVFLFPSLTETFGNVTLEALASGVPTVAYDYGAAREHILDDAIGVRVPFGDGDAFVAGSVALARDDARRARMRIAARQAVERLNPASVTASFANLLASLAGRKAA